MHHTEHKFLPKVALVSCMGHIFITRCVVTFVKMTAYFMLLYVSVGLSLSANVHAVT